MRSFPDENLISWSATLTRVSRRLAVLLHPIWLGALLLLVINDHLLKRAGVAPVWLTGKLSDFAGLIVAPVLLAAVLGARRGPARLACFAAVVIPFAAINLLPQAARLAEAVTASLHIPWRVWSDPTDLLALIVLPWAWRVSAPKPEPTADRRPRPVELFLAVVGAVACMATSASIVEFETSVYLINATRETLDVRIYRATRPLDCDVTRKRAEQVLLPADFAFERDESVESFVPLPLDRSWQKLIDGHPDEDANSGAACEPRCDAVVLLVPGLPTTLVFWSDIGDVKVDDPFDMTTDGEDPHGLHIEGAGDRLFIKGTWAAEVHAVAWQASELPFHNPDAVPVCSEAP